MIVITAGVAESKSEWDLKKLLKSYLTEFAQSASLPRGMLAQPVQLNAYSQKFRAYLTGVKSLSHLFHRGEA
jgi:hypothetical protein